MSSKTRTAHLLRREQPGAAELWKQIMLNLCASAAAGSVNGRGLCYEADTILEYYYNNDKGRPSK